MKEVAFQLGFEDVAHFSKFFKTVCGKNFSTYKKERLL
jgi:AraC family transcriptional activator of pobA